MEPFRVAGVEDLLPGDLGFYTIAGRVGGAVSLGQALLRDECRFTHAYVVVETSGTWTVCDVCDGTGWPPSAHSDGWPCSDCYGTGRLGTLGAVEAMPRGAQRVDQGQLEERVGPAYGYVRLPLSDEQRAAVSRAALDLVGTPYSFMDYVALALWEYGWTRPIGGSALRRYVSGSGRMICSQLVDHVLCKIGFHLFTDGRLHQDVTPGQLWWQASGVGQSFTWPPAGPARSDETDPIPRTSPIVIEETPPL